MEWTRIETLVEKYWEGETTVAEERELKAFFFALTRQKTCPKHSAR